MATQSNLNDRDASTLDRVRARLTPDEMTSLTSVVALWTLRIAFLLFITVPLYNAFRMSLTPLNELANPVLFPRHFHVENYVAAFDYGALQFVINSLAYATAVTILNLIVSVPAAYALSRYDFLGKNLFMFTLLFTQMFAAIVIVPGLFILANELGLRNTYVGFLLPMTAITLALSVWLLKGFFDSIGIEIEEAARIDGCSRLQALRQVIIPMSAPGVMTAGIFTFITGYSNFVLPLILFSDQGRYPIAVGIYTLLGGLNTPYSMMMAMTVIGIVPIMVIYATMQRYIVEGLTSGGVKA
ncbi:carbohydrate ABC transporter permease [Halobium palmae]|uniref:Carbohydrate ABC transporter permease n=1 Tax=Halobium palmae TaxID=1776492 RepID=A0ABD5RWH8_9EURY